MKKLLFGICMLFSVSLFAQQEKGDLSIQFSGNYYSQKVEYAGEKFQSTAGNIYVKIGQFFTPNIEMGLKPNVSFYLEPDDSDSDKKNLRANIGLGLYGTYSFLTADGKMIPYAGGEINYIPVGKESTVNLGPYAGIKYFIRENINVDANANYSLSVGSSFGEGALDIGGLLMINVGIGVIIGGQN